MEDWYRRLKNTQNHAPEDLGMPYLAYSDVRKAVERIAELEQENKRLREALEIIASHPFDGAQIIAEEALEKP